MDVIDNPKHGSIIYHPSILPKHRGASAINWYEREREREREREELRKDGGFYV